MEPGDRTIVAVTFIILGPFVGGLGLWLYDIGVHVILGSPIIPSALYMLGIFLLGGYLGGFVPALIAGLCFSTLPVRWQRVVVALPIGALAGGFFGLVVGSVIPGPSGNIVLFFVGVGAFAAAICAFAARQILVWRGRRYTYDGGIGGA